MIAFGWHFIDSLSLWLLSLLSVRCQRSFVLLCVCVCVCVCARLSESICSPSPHFPSLIFVSSVRIFPFPFVSVVTARATSAILSPPQEEKKEKVQQQQQNKEAQRLIYLLLYVRPL